MKVKINLAKPLVAVMPSVSVNKDYSLPSMAKVADPQTANYYSLRKPAH